MIKLKKLFASIVLSLVLLFTITACVPTTGTSTGDTTGSGTGSSIGGDTDDGNTDGDTDGDDGNTDGDTNQQTELLPTYDISSLQVAENSAKTDIVNGTATFKAMTVTNGDTTLNYRIYIPSTATTQETPVLFFFHGAGESAGYNREPASYYTGFVNLFSDADSPILDSIVIVPQCNGKTMDAADKNNRWVTVDNWSGTNNNPYYTDSIAESKQLDTVLKLLKYYDESESVQVNRDQIYSMGMSMGGFATWDLLVRHTDVFAAGIPICGGCDVSNAKKLKNVPIYTFHGTADSTVYPVGTEQMVAALKAAGNTDVTYVKYEGASHGIWNQAMETEGLMDWLYSKKLSDRVANDNDGGNDDVGGGEDAFTYTRVDKDGLEDATGNYILFGSYPQRMITSETITTALTTDAGDLPTAGNAGDWTSYGYYISNSNATDYMWYQDVSYDGDKYRGVYFTSYRPNSISGVSSEGSSKQDDNGYTTNNVYWFKYEPIKWQITKEESGYATILCDMVIDSREYNIIKSENEYATSSIRAWLNDNFYETAFSGLQQALIQTVTVDNSAESTNSDTNQYVSPNTQDNVWLLSYQEAVAITGSANNDNGGARSKKPTDYAYCQGVQYAYYSATYWLRSPDSAHSYKALYVNTFGGCNSTSFVETTTCGVRPAVQIKLS